MKPQAFITKEQADRYYKTYLASLGCFQVDNKIKEVAPSNKGINLEMFKYQLTNWYSLEELNCLIKGLRKTDYGTYYIIKQNMQNRKFAMFTQGKLHKEKEIRIKQEPYYFCILRKKFYMVKHLPKTRSINRISSFQPY